MDRNGEGQDRSTINVVERPVLEPSFEHSYVWYFEID